MGPTIHDVARLAGTSKSTVSRYLNGQKVKRATEIALEKAIAELNFHRNANARRLVMSKTNTIGIIVENISNVFYSGIIRGIEAVAGNKGFNCIFYSWTAPFKSERDFLHLLYEGQVDGLIFVSFRKRTEEELDAFEELGHPIALVGDHGGREKLLSVDVDNAAGLADVVRYLHGLGHREIAYIAGPASAGASKYRMKGFRQTMEELSLPIRPEWITESDWSNQGGYEAMLRLLKNEGFTAVVASNDETAVGALRAIRECGLSVPSQLSLAGFDDINISEWVYPPLTTVKQPFQEIGAQAAQGLFRLIEDGGPEEPERFQRLLKPELIVRHSCGSPAAVGGQSE